MVEAFITVRFLDILDVLLVAFFMYQLYMIIKGSMAMNIFVGLFSVYLVWLIVKALNMQLLSTILGQFMGVGMIALIIVFQQELRRFLLLIGSRYFYKRKFSLENLFSFGTKTTHEETLKSISQACINMSKTKTGALIVITGKSELDAIIHTGDLINATVSNRLLETIFYKNNPLHDGALIIVGDKIKAARCVLPVSDSTSLSARYGMRHRAALGITESTDSTVVIVSEQTGKIAISKAGELESNINTEDLLQKMEAIL